MEWAVLFYIFDFPEIFPLEEQWKDFSWYSGKPNIRGFPVAPLEMLECGQPLSKYFCPKRFIGVWRISWLKISGWNSFSPWIMSALALSLYTVELLCCLGVPLFQNFSCLPFVPWGPPSGSVSRPNCNCNCNCFQETWGTYLQSLMYTKCIFVLFLQISLTYRKCNLLT